MQQITTYEYWCQSAGASNRLDGYRRQPISHAQLHLSVRVCVGTFNGNPRPASFHLIPIQLKLIIGEHTHTQNAPMMGFSQFNSHINTSKQS